MAETHYQNVPINVLATAERQGMGFVPMPDAVRIVYSAEILFAALPALKYDPFTTKRTELGQQPGKTIAIPRLGTIRRGGKLIEGERMKTQAMSSSMVHISVGERGNAIGLTELLLQTSFYDQMSTASIHLGRDMTVTLDLEIRDAAHATTNIVRADGATPNVEAASRGTIVGTFNTRMVDDMVETLETNNVPKYDGDYYICFIHPHQARGLRDDSDWVNAQLYSDVSGIFNGEIGRYNDVRFITTTVQPNGANSATDAETGDYVDFGYDPDLDGTGASSADLYKALMMGENAVGFALSLPVELRDNGVTDFGREHALAWYAIWGVDLMENGHAVVGESA